MLVDYENTTSYALLITATDLVIPTTDRKTVSTLITKSLKSTSSPLSHSLSKQDTTYLYITVADENDNVPQFSSESYAALVDEEEPTGTNVILVYLSLSLTPFIPYSV